ncbi:isochorismate synthase MenF [Bacillus salitolerans]|uniref:Isochorismate synthase MenF n=1 Tax=Bacillus salitolerans TaxID=1437434 RepID=A0ABW4LWA0_9BACI
MATIQQTKWHDNIVDGIKEANRLQQPILISRSDQIEDIDPLIFFTVGRRLFKGERFYWREPSKNEWIVGLGSAYSIQSNERTSKRFENIEEEWNDLINNGLLFLEEPTKATGPLLFGGFSFDPYKERTPLWRDFPESKLFIPKFMLTYSDGKMWLTINMVVTEANNPEVVFQQQLMEEKHILQSVKEPFDFSEECTYTEEEIEVEKWLQSIKDVVSHIQNGELDKAVLARELKLVTSTSFPVEAILYRLQENQASSYIFAHESGKSVFIGATPERLIKKDQEKLFSTCLAGSIRRGESIKEDELLEQELLNDHKNLVEHQFVVDMIAKEMEQVCVNIKKPSKPSVFKAKDIQHLYTPIIGEAKEGTPLLTIVQKLHPTPALGGFPQEKALQEIREHEALDRGWYAGPIGWMDSRGNGEFAVAIRSGLFQENRASLFAGCGIVDKSEPNQEYEETQIKFKPMLTAIGGMVNE